jgi:chromosomal replication initiator protein
MISITDNKKLWERVLAEIELNVSKANFTTWFKNTYVYKQENGGVVVAVPNAFVKDWLHKKYHNMILKILRGIDEGVRSLDYVITKDDPKKQYGEIPKTVNINAELPLADHYINKEDNLNPRYTFESFVVGSFNELAFAASQAVVKKPGIAYNPLFIHGGTGHGKTHLIQAIGNQIKTVMPGKRVYYTTSEKFAIDFFNSLQNNKVNYFKEKYRKYDVLIMDDIQFFSGKEKTQEELFHLFNNLYDSNRQIIFSSDKHPNFIPSLEDRLKSRFSAGMIIDIPPPDPESRVAIIKAKAKISGLILSDEIINLIAESLDSNIRELEGILNLIYCQTNLKARNLSIFEVKNLLKNSQKPKRNISAKEVVKVVADFYNISENSIYEKTRKKEVVKPRQIVMYLLREDFNVSYPSIGSKLGGRDHTTVIHSCEKIKNDIKNDVELANELQQIRAML